MAHVSNTRMKGGKPVRELRLLDPNGYTVPGTVTTVPDEEAAAATHRLRHTIAVEDANSPINEGAGYQPHLYRVQATDLPEETR